MWEMTKEKVDQLSPLRPLHSDGVTGVIAWIRIHRISSNETFDFPTASDMNMIFEGFAKM